MSNNLPPELNVILVAEFFQYNLYLRVVCISYLLNVLPVQLLKKHYFNFTC